MNSFSERNLYPSLATDARKISGTLYPEEDMCSRLLVINFSNYCLLKIKKDNKAYQSFPFPRSILSIRSGHHHESGAKQLYEKLILTTAKLLFANHHRKFTSNVEKLYTSVNKFSCFPMPGSVVIRYLETLFHKLNCTANLL